MIDTSAVRPLISLTSHERIDVLVGQVCNMLDSFASGARVIVHRSSNWVPLHNPEEEAWWEAALAELPGVTVNPERYGTRWAHMFHAHVSNLRYALANDPDWTTLVLHSSGDLMVRPGVERILATHDYGGATGAVKPETPWQWVPAIFGDEVLMRMAAGRPIRASMHESTFYRRDLAAEMLAELDAHVTDWEYDDKYPKEEVFFPTLAGERGLSVATKYAHLVRFNQTLDTAVIGLGMRMLRSGSVEGADALAAASPVWPYVPFGCAPRELYCLGRIPRDRDHPLRRAIMSRSPRWRELTARGHVFSAAPDAFQFAAEVDIWSGSASPETVTAVVEALRDQSYFQPGPMLDEEGRWYPDTGGKPENRFMFAGLTLRSNNAPPFAAVIVRPKPAFMGVQTVELALHAWRGRDDAQVCFRKMIDPRPAMSVVAVVVGASADERRGLKVWIESGEAEQVFEPRHRTELSLGGDAVLVVWRFEDLPVDQTALVLAPERWIERLQLAGPVAVRPD